MGQVVNQIDQANRRCVTPPPNVAKLQPFHGLAHVVEDVFTARLNPGLLAIAFFLLAAQG